MVRKLKYHEQKLLKKVDFVQWKTQDNIREVKVLRKYHIQNREDYHKYNKICGYITSLATQLTLLPADDPVRREIANNLLEKLFRMGIIPSKDCGLSGISQIAVSAFCRRRLGVVMNKLKMAESVKEAVTFIEQGHVRVGPETVTDPAYLVTRNMEDYVTWVDTSKIKRKVAAYNDKLDDFDLM